MAVGGSIESVTLDGRTFSVAADAETQRKLGGFINEIVANGDGTARQIKTREPLSIEGLALSIDDDNGDQEFLQALADRNDFWPLAITYASGKVYQGSAQITGDMQTSSQAQTAAVNLMGPGILTPQS